MAEVAGHIRYRDLLEGQTVEERVDEVTFLTRKVVIESRSGGSLKPALEIVDAKGKVLSVDERKDARYALPIGVTVSVDDGEEVKPGDVLGRIPREITRTRDITGGLPRVAELFEARKPKEPSIMVKGNGTVSFGDDVKGKRQLIITDDDGGEEVYAVPKGKHVFVTDGDYVRKGEIVSDGGINPHDILKIKGEIELAKYLVDEIQEVYRLQGVRINDKHIEVIVRQMLRRSKILDPGDSRFLEGEQVGRAELQEANAQLEAEGKQKVVSEPVLLGITKASLATESFISAASFQETTRILTDASLNSKTDSLRGLKENVIMGRLIPAGTGAEFYQGITSQVQKTQMPEQPSEPATTSETEEVAQPAAQ